MGWIGWTHQETMATDVNAVTRALASRSDLIRLVFGDGKSNKPIKKRNMVKSFKDFAKRHNRSRGKDNG